MKILNGKSAIYVLTNPSFPEYVKIEYADNLEKRLNQLSISEYIIPFALILPRQKSTL